jgi:hypothetical protein
MRSYNQIEEYTVLFHGFCSARSRAYRPNIYPSLPHSSNHAYQDMQNYRNNKRSTEDNMQNYRNNKRSTEDNMQNNHRNNKRSAEDNMQNHRNNKCSTEDDVQDSSNKRPRTITSSYPMANRLVQPGNYFLPNPSDPAAVCRFLSNSSPMDIYTKSIEILAMMRCSTAALEGEIVRLRQENDDTATAYKAENKRLNQLLQDLGPLRKEITQLRQLMQEREMELKIARKELEELESSKIRRMLETDVDALQEDLDAAKEELELKSAELERRKKINVKLWGIYEALEELLDECGFA